MSNEVIFKRKFISEVVNAMTKAFWAIPPVENEAKTEQSTLIAVPFDGKPAVKVRKSP